MALNDNELFSTVTGKGAEIRMIVHRNKVGTLAAQTDAPLLPRGTPLVWNGATSLWTAWTQGADAAIYTITAAGTAASGGTFIISVNGVPTQVAYNATAAQIAAALVANGIPATAVATTGANLGANNAVVTVTFGEQLGAPVVDLDLDALTGNAHALAASDPGTALVGSGEIRGFLADSGGVQSHATNEVQCIVLLEGEIHRDDINTAAIRAVLGGSPSEAELDAALAAPKLRELGIHIRGLAAVH